jgi:hypothetical protein
MKTFCTKLSASMFFLFIIIFSGAALSFGQAIDTTKDGLLFYLSGDKGFTADYACGKAEPNFLSNVKIIKDGAKGVGFECAHTQLMSYWAPGNIYAERGSLSFFWRSREPVGKTAFPIFRVGYADHSSWDMVWLRIDYNGKGFDAFVTDVNLARVRVSYILPSTPDPRKWIHFTLTWDETQGIRFYIDGKKIAEKDTSDVFYIGLDQFGPHSRIISPHQVQSAYNFVRSGDIDEIRIYDRALPDSTIVSLAQGNAPIVTASKERSLSQTQWNDEWKLRYGWNRPGDVPPYLSEKNMSIRKVEILEAYDHNRWFWKATDGIRETTWPGVYNRSRLTGRNDYFQLPDWDCYVSSGIAVRFNMPEEPWNYLEMQGAAYGTMALSEKKDGSDSTVIFNRPKDQERTFHKFEKEITGKTLVFTNVAQETPLGEISAYDIRPGKAPQGIVTLEYKITFATVTSNINLNNAVNFIKGRFTADECTILQALPAGVPKESKAVQPKNALPIIHILIPSDFRSMNKTGNEHIFSYTWDNMYAGLDGIEIELPALNVKPTCGEYFPMNIQIKDPLLLIRNLADVSFSVKPNEPHTIWFDLRDKILPNGKPLYLTIAGSGSDFTPAMLEGASIRLIFKPYKEAAKEHIADRFAQVRDSYAWMVEEHTNSTKLNIYNKFSDEIDDLLRVAPDHYPGRWYWYDYNQEQAKPEFTQAVPPKGIPLWAFRQIEDLKSYKKFIEWYIDHRQVKNDGFGGGLSDDSDLGNMWPGLALMGCIPDKVKDSDCKLMESIYANGMNTGGLNTIQTDGLHSYEEGTNVLAQVNLLDFGNPKQVERMMQTVHALKEKILGVNKAGHTHFRSFYYGANAVAEEGVWAWTLPHEYLNLQPAIYLGDFYGNAMAKKIVTDVADGLLAHAHKDSTGKTIVDVEINYSTDESRSSTLGSKSMLTDAYNRMTNVAAQFSAGQLLWASWRWTGEQKYLQPLLDMGYPVLASIPSNALDIANLRDTWGKQIAATTTPDSKVDVLRHFAWQVTGNKKYLENYYANQIEADADREYINTEGSLWTDRLYIAEREIQRSRLGGVADSRNGVNPGHVVSWNFNAPASGESVAILVRSATPSAITIEVFNLEKTAVTAAMTGWDVLPGKWKIIQGIDINDDGKPETNITQRNLPFECSASISFTFAPRKSTIITMRLIENGIPYTQRADLAIGKEDVSIDGRKIRVIVHNLGAAANSPTTCALVDAKGTVITEVNVPAIQPPADLLPKTMEITLDIPKGIDVTKASIRIDPKNKLSESTKLNNEILLPGI